MRNQAFGKHTLICSHLPQKLYWEDAERDCPIVKDAINTGRTSDIITSSPSVLFCSVLFCSALFCSALWWILNLLFYILGFSSLQLWSLTVPFAAFFDNLYTYILWMPTWFISFHAGNVYVQYPLFARFLVVITFALLHISLVSLNFLFLVVVKFALLHIFSFLKILVSSFNHICTSEYLYFIKISTF